MDSVVLARIVHGSHLFGLSTENSDRDFVSIILPSTSDILLGRTHFITDYGTTGNSTRKNTKSDVDEKQISLAEFMNLLMTGTLDMIEFLNAPIEFHVQKPHPIFMELRRNRHRLASRNVEKIIGFCTSQAITYSPRKDRLIAAQIARDTFLKLGVDETSKERAGVYFDRVVDACGSVHVSVKLIPTTLGKDIAHLDICGKMVPETVHVSQALTVADAAAKRYGRRVHDAASTSSHDWKSLSHALRIASEGIEYLRTGEITLPLPNRTRLLDIKLGCVPLEEVSEEVEETVRHLKEESLRSTLPAEIDRVFADEFVMSVHGRQVVDGFPEVEATFVNLPDLNLSTAPSKLTTSFPIKSV